MLINNDMVNILILSFCFDLLFGEPPELVHPVVWIGKIVYFLFNKIKCSNGRFKGFIIVIISLLFSCMIYLFLSFISSVFFVPYFIKLIISAYFLKCTFSIKYMVVPAFQIYNKLITTGFNNIHSLDNLKIYVSRNTKHLNKEQIISCVIESISENYVDSVLSPLFYYLLFGSYGILGAYLYKCINTLDSMIGYKTKEFVDIGYTSAKLDDILNYLPSRLSIFFMFIGSFISLMKYNKLNPLCGIKIAIIDHIKTNSPNSGWPMSMMAGILRKKLEKKGEYILGSCFEYPDENDIIKTCFVFISTSIITLFILVLFIFYFIN